MEGSVVSETGAVVGGSEEVHPAVARALALAEQARQRDQQAPSPGSQVASTGGDTGVPVTGLRRSGIPRLYLAADWRKVRDGGVQQWSLGVAARTQRRSDPTPPNWSLLGHGLLILGPVGTGKSSAAALCGLAGLRADRSAKWTYVPDLIDLLSAGNKERREEIKHQSVVDLLIWDDFGVRDMADWEIGYLDQIVEARYRSRKPMIVTSNWTAGDLRNDVRLSRLVDRWRERVCSNVVILAGESMRGLGNEKDGIQ